MRLKKDIISCESGGVFILVAIMIPVLFGVMAITVDISRMYAVQSKAQNAADAAILGAVATKDYNSKANLTNDQALAIVEEETKNLFNTNYPTDYMGSTVSKITVTSPDGQNTFQANFDISVPTILMQQSASTINIKAQASIGYSEVYNQQLELALVLDNTGSMKGTPIDGLKSAATSLTNIVFGGSEELNNVHVSVIPYDVAVNIGNNHVSWAKTGTDASNYTLWANNSSNSAGFLADRDGFTDAAPQDEATRFYVPPAFGWPGYTLCGTTYINNPTSPKNTNFVCNTLAPVKFALNKRSDVINAINTMQAAGDTRINVGLMWGWFALSPNWQGVWDAGKPGYPASKSARLQKSLVLMTDGKNSEFMTGSVSADDDKTQKLCSAIKGQGITIYTIGYGAPGTLNSTLLKACATSSTNYFEAPTADQLKQVFKAIADDIIFKTLRLSQ